MTLVEVMMGALLMCVGLLGIFDTLSASGRSIAAGERMAVMTQVAQDELASVTSLPYTSIADSSAPTKTTTTDKTNPTYYLSTGCGGTCYQWNPSSTTSTEQVLVDATNGKVAPGPTTAVVSAPSTTGCAPTSTGNCRIVLSVYIFVTTTTDAVCSQTGVTCSGASYKRVTVAVKNAGRGAPLNPVYVSSFVGAKAGGTNNPLTSGSTTCLDGTTTVSCTH